MHYRKGGDAMRFHKIPEAERNEIRTRAADMILDAFDAVTSCDTNLRPTVAVTFQDQLTGDDEMWHAWISFDRPLDVIQMRAVCDVCDRFTMNDLTFTVGGREYRIGDGDDSLAAMFIGGMIRVWVRHLAE
jgi:hypothetical protein